VQRLRFEAPQTYEPLNGYNNPKFEKKATHDKKIRNAMIHELIRYPSRVFEQKKK